MAEQMSPLSERLHAFLDAYESGAKVPARSAVEPTVTEGYARALELDAECLRLGRRIDRVMAALAAGRQAPQAKLPELVRRLRAAEAEVTALRALLAPLRRRVAKAA